MLEAKRNGTRVTVVFIDLDNFKTVNARLGHNAGDFMLKTVASRMVGSVRASDTVARLGGDEFVILLIDGENHPVAVSVVLDKIRAAIVEPIAIEGSLLRTTCSIGLAAFPEDVPDAETLLTKADVAMYRAKKSRSNSEFYAI